MAVDVVVQARRSSTFAIWSAGCASTSVPDDDRCGARLWTVLRSQERTTIRAAAAAALVARGEPEAVHALADLLRTAQPSTLVQVLPIIEKLPAADAVPLLVRLSQSSSETDQSKACEALSAFDDPASRAAITKTVAGNPAGTRPWLYCMIARARLHETVPPGAVAGYGDTLKDEGQLFAAKVMLESGNDAAVELLTGLTHRGDARSRLVAADLLVDVRTEAAIPVIEAGETNPDPAIRAVALESERRLKRPPPSSVRAMLTDTAGNVRVRAADVVIDWVRRSQTR
jgi:HEAT repeat protein